VKGEVLIKSFRQWVVAQRSASDSARDSARESSENMVLAGPTQQQDH